MKKIKKIIWVFVMTLIINGIVSATPEIAARGVLKRFIGKRSDDFILKTIPKVDSKDVFEISAKNGKVTVAGSSGVAISRGTYEYLKETCNAIFSWEGSRIDLPEKFPYFPKKRVINSHEFVHYFNACTFGYTMVWWDWERWEREIDWMALHGINMPLALNGQEAVWWKVWKSYGITDKELGEYFTGPAFLPWHRMGNVNGHAGPLPVTWMEGQKELQKKILARERELGMTPILQGFAGFAPIALSRVKPKVKMLKNAGWCGLPPTQMINPHDPFFTEVGKRFTKEMIKEFGTDHYYLSDSFIEMEPPVSEHSKKQDLKAVGNAVYQSMAEVDPKAVWVMMGWPFLCDPIFWDEDAITSMFSSVPHDKLILLDLAVESKSVWKMRKAFRDRLWISSIIQNYGMTSPMFGDLKFYATVHSEELKNPETKNMVGLGITPEGIEQNPVVFELQTDAAWSTEPIDINNWLKKYSKCRYGACPPKMTNAWQNLLDTYYEVNHTMATVTGLAMQPDLGHHITDTFDKEKIKKAIKQFLECSDELSESDLYRRDLIDFIKAYIMLSDRYQIEKIQEAQTDGDIKKRNKLMNEFLVMLKDLDRLVATRPEHHLSNWIKASRSWGKNKKEADYYEMNARYLIAQWGGSLYDYAWKIWSGMINDYYYKRWQQKFDMIKKADGKKIDYDAMLNYMHDWEMKWIKSTRKIKENPAGGEILVATEIFNKYADWPDNYDPPPENPGLAFRKTAHASNATNSVPNHPANFIVDGKTDDSERSWWADSYPQWVGVDLGKITTIKKIQLITYWGDNRYYQYTIEISKDAVDWTTVVDMSTNTTPATPEGFTHEIEPVETRFVKVNMLYHNLNKGVHVVELKVF